MMHHLGDETLALLELNQSVDSELDVLLLLDIA